MQSNCHTFSWVIDPMGAGMLQRPLLLAYH